ncbi:TIGR04283 family arsenosugar biosynthesis glycosyltransferase [Muriicola marianensis]|uniref:Glycosyl hydrolase n=1 Tax=Muriicola marianensis TaxID=1324801 RepID=A0ABQ1R1U3_9FLAO|nr:TIGR04283 family arsenosugar biosynthesis glycosyltransferase [Muriicola marianensis]GGD53215.1 glycosyl hydrolase [Muriicola marianensis]
MRKSDSPEISVIIPVLNEEENLQKLIPYLRQEAGSGEDVEIIVVDGGSSDHSVEVAESFGVRVLSAPRGRARQLNAGARVAQGKILYFLHADSVPPADYDGLILDALENKTQAGCFRLQFDSPSLFLRFFAWFSRFNFPICRGGDQSLFISRELFDTLRGFDERYRVYEDNEFVGRIYRRANFKVLPYELRTSARKYKLNGRFKLQYHFACIHWLYFRGKGPDALYAYYDKYIKQGG